MSLAEWKTDMNGTIPHAPAQVPEPPKRELHRVREIRQQQGISLRCAARRLGVSVDQIRDQEEGTSDMLLSKLYQWQELLEVPVASLLVEDNDPLSEPVLKRARMIRLMKTAAAILENAQTDALERLAQMLVGQLVEMMPELEEVSPWHAVGQRRTLEEVGRIAENPFPDTLFHDSAFR